MAIDHDYPARPPETAISGVFFNLRVSVQPILPVQDHPGGMLIPTPGESPVRTGLRGSDLGLRWLLGVLERIDRVSLGYLTPAEFEEQWRNEHALAFRVELRIAPKVSNFKGSLQS